ncbi:YlcI/YnfO family protein [Ideonella sp. YS5]|uniref:YlcI/YnfO family protein n=1 Tax=Ideonella sp. YS5 TaxID=3453714 RepID=UPI003EE8EC40
MSRTANLPPIRVTPETKSSAEAVLRKGESLTQFIESAVCREVEFRAEQGAAIARAKKALRAADKGVGVMTADDFLAGMQQRAEAAQGRIRAAVAARSNKRAAG